MEPSGFFLQDGVESGRMDFIPNLMKIKLFQTRTPHIETDGHVTYYDRITNEGVKRAIERALPKFSLSLKLGDGTMWYCVLQNRL